jgi:small ligand-binding sensory domain FIST
VFVGAAEPQITPELIEGVKKHFPVDVIYGCQTTSPLVAESNFPDVPTIDIPAGVMVWALGGDIDLEVFTVSTSRDSDFPYEDAGVELGQAIKPYVEGLRRPGKMIFTFGDQYNGSNKDFVVGLNNGLGKTCAIVGAAAGNQTAKEIVRGEIVVSTNVAVAIGGPFRLGQALQGGTHSPETADTVMGDAVSQGGGQSPFFAMIFNCRRRRQGMIERGQLAEELDRIRSRLPGVEFFGFYGPGEVGSEKPGDPAKGVGFTVTTAVFFPAT